MKKFLGLCLVFLISLGFFGCSQSPTGGTVAVVEQIDATWCIKCPPFNFAMDKLNQEFGSTRVVMINYYVQSTDDHPFPRLSCPEAEDRMKWYMTDQGIPDIFFNGGNQIKGLPPHDSTLESVRDACYNALKEKVLPINQKLPAVSLTLTATKKENGDLEIKATCQANEALTYKDLHLLICLTESKIPYTAINGDKMHYFVFREWVQPSEFKGNVGIPMTLSQSGDKFETTISFKPNTDLYKNELNLVVFAQDFETKAILQALQLSLKE
jgi:hypothetical protein